MRSGVSDFLAVVSAWWLTPATVVERGRPVKSRRCCRESVRPARDEVDLDACVARQHSHSDAGPRRQAIQRKVRQVHLDHPLGRFPPPGPLGQDDSPRAWTTSIGAPAPPHHDGEDEISQVPRRPLPACPALRTRRTAYPRQLRDSDEAFRRKNSVGSATMELSGLDHAAYRPTVYASQSGSLLDHATLGSGWWPALAGQDSHLLGRKDGFRHVCPSTWLPPSPSFARRNFSYPPARHCVVAVFLRGRTRRRTVSSY